jgi:hypothetical protein
LPFSFDNAALTCLNVSCHGVLHPQLPRDGDLVGKQAACAPSLGR